MTALSIHSPSAPVAQSLRAIAEATGATPDAAAEWQLRHQDGALLLKRGEQTLYQLSLPARPAAIAQFLTQLGHAPAPLAHGWQFDATARQLTREGTTHTLTEKETLLLAQLLASHPAPCPRELLLKEVWGVQADIETHTLETHIYRLRQKLGELAPKPCDIITTESAYQLALEPSA